MEHPDATCAARSFDLVAVPVTDGLQLAELWNRPGGSSQVAHHTLIRNTCSHREAYTMIYIYIYLYADVSVYANYIYIYTYLCTIADYMYV